MSRNTSSGEERASFSPTQRKACLILIVCLLVLIASIFGAWKIMGLTSSKTTYDPKQYPVDTTLGAVLPSTSDAGNEYQTSTLFAGDRQAVALTSLGQITLDQFVGEDSLLVSDVIRKACVYFEGDSTAYTITQAVAKMKPRRIVLAVGTNDALAGTAVDTFLQDYKQAAKGIADTYSYADLIVNAVPPIPKTYENAAAVQTLIDQYNQALAVLCNDAGYRFLNSSETLKAATGYGDESYFDAASGLWNKQGATTLMTYLRCHALTSDDRRPDTNDIPKRVAQSTASSTAASPTPSATPAQLTASYGVEEGKGTLTGNGQSGVTGIEAKVAARSTVSVTAVPADGYTFYKWSDGQTSATRYDIVTQDINVTAMFNDARVSINLDKGDTTLNIGETVSVNASVKLGSKDYDSSNVQWAVNGDLQANGPSYTFTATAAGEFKIKAGIEINGNYQSAEMKVTVNAPATTISVNYAAQMQAGSTTSLAATVTNPVGDTVWTCDEMPDWKPTGATVNFTPPTTYDITITYHLHVTNNNVKTDFTIAVAPAPAPAPAQSTILTPGAGTVGYRTARWLSFTRFGQPWPGDTLGE